MLQKQSTGFFQQWVYFVDSECDESFCFIKSENRLEKKTKIHSTSFYLLFDPLIVYLRYTLHFFFHNAVYICTMYMICVFIFMYFTNELFFWKKILIFEE